MFRFPVNSESSMKSERFASIKNEQGSGNPYGLGPGMGE
jgi:hypothetical protein